MGVWELVFGLIGGTALLMYGIDLMGEGLERAAGPMMKKILSALTGTVFRACLAGTGLTVLVQSSTAITVLTVGFVNAGLMSLKQAVGIIYGANIGTTITAQLMSFHFKLTDIALLILGVGFLIKFIAKKPRVEDIGQALMGFGIMFLGLKILNSGIPFVKENDTIRFFFEHYANMPLLAILMGMVATMLVHSSSATVGLTMVLATHGLINLDGAIGLMLGDNIGTCVTAQLASVGTSVSARRTAWAHTLYNVFGVLLAMLVFKVFKELIIMTSGDIARQIANSHTIFNVLSAVIGLPLTGIYVRFLERIVPDKSKGVIPDVARYLDPLLLDTPQAAMDATVKEIMHASDTAFAMVEEAMEAPLKGNFDKLPKVIEREKTVNELQEYITQYLVSLSQKHPGGDVHDKIPALLHSINDIERIGDHAENLAELAEQMKATHQEFSDGAKYEMGILVELIRDMAAKTTKAFLDGDVELARQVLTHETKVDELCDRLKEGHVTRLELGTCKVHSGIVFLDMVTNLERIADHYENIAEVVAFSFNWAERRKYKEIEKNRVNLIPEAL